MTNLLESITSMTRNDVFEAERNESEYYRNKNRDDEVRLPVTRIGFEALLREAASLCVLPVDDQTRKLLCGFVHSLSRYTDTTTIKAVASAIHKSFANQLTYMIDQELDTKIRAEQQATNPDLKLVETNETEANH